MKLSTTTAALSFSKYCAAGNDFILIEESDWDPSDVPRLCDRRYGIGADGVLWTEGKRRMHIYNADGSKAEMCGNGLRALAYHLGEDTTIETDAGLYPVRSDGAIGMPLPTVTTVDGYPLIDSGVPHLILEGDWDPKPLRHKYNANVSALIDGKARTFERGVEGLTLSCGTGALALSTYYELPQIEFECGETLHFKREMTHVWMWGNVQKSFEGKIWAPLLEPKSL